MSRIVTITLNPAIDVYTSVEHLSSDTKLRCASERRDAGGGGINVARVIRRLGGDALAIYAAGGAVGSLLEHLVMSEGVHTLETPIDGETRESFTVVERCSGKEFRFVLPGPSITEQDLQRVLETFEGLAPQFPLYVVCSGSLPPGAPVDAYARIAVLAKKHGCRVVLDASGDALRAALQTGAVYLAKPSLNEFKELVRQPLGTTDAIVAAARGYIASGDAEIIVVTLGASGAIVVTSNQAMIAPAIAAPVVSSVGAGDSFLGALIWALDTGHALPDAFRYALAAGAASLGAEGTQLCAQADVEALLPRADLKFMPHRSDEPAIAGSDAPPSA
jgi:6-phosphofructokinase 2